MSLCYYKTTEELQELLYRELKGNRRERPENNFFENALKIAIAGEFTATTLEVYGYPDADPQYFFFLEYSEVQCPNIMVRAPLFGHDLTLLKEVVPLVLEEAKKHIGNHNTLLVSGDEATCAEFDRQVSICTGGAFASAPSLGFTGVFYMTAAQREALLEENLVAPAGFSFESVDVHRDAETIHRLWKTSLNLDVTKNRLRHLPSMAARTDQGELAGWSMAARFGQVTNLYVLPAYRNRGLGKALELSVAREFARRGMRVFKYVETTNTSVYEGSLRSRFWTLWTVDEDEEEGNDRRKKPKLHLYRKYERVAADN